MKSLMYQYFLKFVRSFLIILGLIIAFFIIYYTFKVIL